MNGDRIRGATIRFTFADGPMAKKTFEHVFDEDGHVSFHMVDAKADATSTSSKNADQKTKYEVAPLREDVVAVSYLSSAGYTLTAVLDFKTKKLVAFSSNEKTLGAQHGTFEVDAPETKRKASGHGHHAHPHG